MPFLARPLIWQNSIRGKTESALRDFLKPRLSSQYSLSSLSQRVYPPRFIGCKYFRIYFLKLLLLLCLLLSTAAHAQYAEIDEDPYLDPAAANEALQPATRAKSKQAYMFGINYGLNPIIILAPALSLGMYWDPVVLGLEISDSETMGIWEKERQENFGTSKFSGETQFIKWFYGDNFYLMAAREHRSIKLWSRTYNRISGKATFDMFIETTVASLGAGLLRFNDIGFLAIDIIRYNLTKNQSVKIVEYWETWTERSGNRDALDQNMLDRSEKWIKTINAPTGFVVTFGVYF